MWATGLSYAGWLWRRACALTRMPSTTPSAALIWSALSAAMSQSIETSLLSGATWATPTSNSARPYVGGDGIPRRQRIQ